MADLRPTAEMRRLMGLCSLDIADHSTTGARAGSATVALNQERVVDSRAGRAWEILVAAFPTTHRSKVRNRRGASRLLTARGAALLARYSPASRSGAE
jgi:hypothetical protein